MLSLSGFFIIYHSLKFGARYQNRTDTSRLETSRATTTLISQYGLHSILNFRRVLPILHIRIRSGRRGGIRTHGTFLFTGFQNQRIRPLSHSSLSMLVFPRGQVKRGMAIKHLLLRLIKFHSSLLNFQFMIVSNLPY